MRPSPASPFGDAAEEAPGITERSLISEPHLGVAMKRGTRRARPSHTLAVILIRRPWHLEVNFERRRGSSCPRSLHVPRPNLVHRDRFRSRPSTDLANQGAALTDRPIRTGNKACRRQIED